jgi:hypothetical protein
MPRQSPLRTIKRWKRYQPKDSCNDVPVGTRGLYVLYRHRSKDVYEVTYIGVAGISSTGGGGIRGRLKSHCKTKKNWTHFSLFEVHDNVTRDEIRELEALLLGIFRHDPRIKLSNLQRGSKKLYQLQKASHWSAR